MEKVDGPGGGFEEKFKRCADFYYLPNFLSDKLGHRAIFF